MKTSSEVAHSIAQHVANVYLSPSMHVGAVDAPYSANSLEALLLALHYHWAFAHDREQEYQTLVIAQRKAAQCDNLGFADAFRRFNEGVTDEEASKFVMRNLREISMKLKMPLTDEAMEVEL